MGGGYFHQDVTSAREAIGTTRTSQRAFDYNRRASRGEVQGVHADLNILGKVRECRDSAEHPESTPIVVAMDVTSSRGSDTKRIYEQVPAMLGSLRVTGIVPDPQIMWAAVGDANTDRAPIQVSQFESDRRIDEQLRQIWMEEGGGGTGEESYELLAYYLAKKTELDILGRGKKGFLFFTGDEAPYATVSKTFVKKYIGDDRKRDLSTKKVFTDLQKKFHTFLMFPRSSMEDRKAAIDTEIRQRLERLGGRFQDVDIRASLIWDDRNDLDLHCLTPDGYHIFYGARRANCGGELDVDRNVNGEDPKPVENIRWAKGDARSGTYRFWVRNYRYHERSRDGVPFKVEIEINGEIQTFEGKTPAGVTGGASDQQVYEFHYTPGANAKKSDDHAAYEDDVILGKWQNYIPEEYILRVQDPRSCVEVMLGAMALQEGKMDLAQFEASMTERRVEKRRREDVLSALADFASHGVFSEVAADVFD